MRTVTKTALRSNRAPILVDAAKWHSIDAATLALNTEYSPVLQPLTEDERRQLLRVALANESFTRDYVDLVATHPEIVPATMHTADTVRDWQTCEELRRRRQALADLIQQMDDTMTALQSGCYAAALAGYQIVTRGATPLGLEAAVARLREHWERRQELGKQTRAAKLALAKAKAEAAASAGSGSSPAPTPASAAVIPMSAGTIPRNGATPATPAA